MGKFAQIKQQYKDSLKSLDTEETLDLMFYRPIGYMWALLAAKLGITPNVITIASIFLGVAAGVLFYFHGDLIWLNYIGIVLLVWANSFDSADGQLARLTHQYSRLGRILDGLSGDFWFVAIYFAICFRVDGTSEFFSQLSDMQVNVPFFMYAEQAADGLNRLNQQRIWNEKPIGKSPVFEVNRDRAREIIMQSASQGREQLTTRESIDVLDAYGIRVCRSGFAVNEEEAVAVAEKVGYPVVMKMTSKTTSHKTDVGGVRVNIQNADDLRAQYRDLIAKLKEKNLLEGLEGVIIQEMVKGSREMVCGVATDPQYGHMVMFGLGGVFIEVMKDVTFRMAPLTDVDADEMIRGVKAYKLLEGARGTTPAQMGQLKECLLRISQLVGDFPAITELDINPLIISEKNGEGIAVDGRIKVDLNKL